MVIVYFILLQQKSTEHTFKYFEDDKVEPLFYPSSYVQMPAGGSCLDSASTKGGHALSHF